MKFENPIIETEYSLQNRYKKHLMNNKDIYIFDLRELIPIYSHYIKRNINIEYYQAKRFLNNHLTNITNGLCSVYAYFVFCQHIHHTQKRLSQIVNITHLLLSFLVCLVFLIIAPVLVGICASYFFASTQHC